MASIGHIPVRVEIHDQRDPLLAAFDRYQDRVVSARGQLEAELRAVLAEPVDDVVSIGPAPSIDVAEEDAPEADEPAAEPVPARRAKRSKESWICGCGRDFSMPAHLRRHQSARGHGSYSPDPATKPVGNPARAAGMAD